MGLVLCVGIRLYLTLVIRNIRKVLVMKQVRLIGKSKHGKDRIRQHGDVWKLIAMHGDRFVLESMHETFTLGDEKIHDVRGVQRIDDPNFKWEKIK